MGNRNRVGSAMIGEGTQFGARQPVACEKLPQILIHSRNCRSMLASWFLLPPIRAAPRCRPCARLGCVTLPRQAVLTWLAEHPHSTAEAIGAGGGHSSVRCLSRPSTTCWGRARPGLLRRIQPAGHSARFERRIADNHHHVVCRRCGRTEDVDCVLGDRPCLTPDDEQGFRGRRGRGGVLGRVPTCMAAEGSATGA